MIKTKEGMKMKGNKKERKRWVPCSQRISYS
jgi:hypothetical protein